MKSLRECSRRVVELSCTACAVALVAAALASNAQAAPPPPVPEIDPGSLASALMLLGGGVLVLRGRIRR